MDDKNLETRDAAEQPGEQQDVKPEITPKGPKEELYDKLPVTKGMMDIICALLIAALVLVIIFGVFHSSGFAT